MDNMDIEDESTLTMIKSLEMLDKENQEKLQLQQASLLEAQRALAQEEKRLKNLQLEQKRLVVEFVNSDLEFHSVQMSIESVQEEVKMLRHKLEDTVKRLVDIEQFRVMQLSLIKAQDFIMTDIMQTIEKLMDEEESRSKIDEAEKKIAELNAEITEFQQRSDLEISLERAALGELQKQIVALQQEYIRLEAELDSLKQSEHHLRQQLDNVSKSRKLLKYLCDEATRLDSLQAGN